MALDNNENPYVCWMDNNSGYFNIYIKHWNGSSWEEVGAGSASGTGISGSTSYHCGMPDITVDQAGLPVVSWLHTTGTDIYHTYVKRFDGSGWIEVGGSSGSGSGISLWGTSAKPWDINSPGKPTYSYYGGSAIAMGNKGAIFSAWPDQHDGNWNIYLKCYGKNLPFVSDYDYIYDELHRLTRIKSDNGITISYEYDPAGNRLHKEVKSELMIRAGDQNPESVNIANNSLDVPIMQIILNVGSSEDMILDYLKLYSSGTGDENADINSVKLWKDHNGDGNLDGGDVQIGSSVSFSSDNGSLSFSGISEKLPKGSELNLLITYSQAGSALIGETFSLRLPDRNNINATGSVSRKSIYVLGCPVEGGILTISNDAIPPVFGGITSATAMEADIILEWPAAVESTSTPVRYNIYQSTTPGGQSFSTPDYSTTDLNYIVTNLDLDTYYFVVRAEDSIGNEDTNTKEENATTVDTTPPDFEGIDSATAILDGSGTVRVNWGTAFDSSIPIAFDVYWSTTLPVEAYTTCSISTTGSSINIDDLSTGVLHYFKVNARERFNNIKNTTKIASATPDKNIDNTPPAFTGLNTATAPNDGTRRIILEWENASDESTPIRYNIYQSTTSNSQNLTNPTYSTQATSYTLTGLINGQTYYYIVRAEDAFGHEESNLIEKSATPHDIIDTAPPEFSGLYLVTPDNEKAHLYWNSAIDPSGPVTYIVYMTQLSGIYDFNTPLLSTSELETEIEGLTNGEFYYFIVQAADAMNNQDNNTIEKEIVPATEVLDWFLFN